MDRVLTPAPRNGCLSGHESGHDPAPKASGSGRHGSNLFPAAIVVVGKGCTKEKERLPPVETPVAEEQDGP